MDRKLGRKNFIVITLDLVKALNKETGKIEDFVSLIPDTNTTGEKESGSVAISFINDVFLKKAEWKNGKALCSLKAWKRPGGWGDRFIKAIKERLLDKSSASISWKDISPDETIMKGLNYTLGTGVPSQSPGGMGGGMNPFDMPGGGPSMGGGMGGGAPLPSTMSTSSAPQLDTSGLGGGSPAPGGEASPQNANYNPNPRKFKDLLEALELKIRKKHRKKLGQGRKQALPFNPRLVIPIIGDDPHSKINRDRRYQRREIRLGKFRN